MQPMKLPGPKARALIKRELGRHLALVSARVSVRDGSRQRHRSLGRGRQSLFGFHGGHRRGVDGSRASKSCEGHPATGGEVHPHLVRFLSRGLDQTGGETGRDRALRRLRRVVHDQLRDGGRGDRHQTGTLPHGTKQLHRLYGRVPRADDGRGDVHRQQAKISQGFLSTDERSITCSIPRSVSPRARTPQRRGLWRDSCPLHSRTNSRSHFASRRSGGDFG